MKQLLVLLSGEEAKENLLSNMAYILRSYYEKAVMVQRFGIKGEEA